MYVVAVRVPLPAGHSEMVSAVAQDLSRSPDKSPEGRHTSGAVPSGRGSPHMATPTQLGLSTSHIGGRLIARSRQNLTTGDKGGPE